MSAPPFTPSGVDLSGSYPPLCDTMRKAEAEAAATMIVRASQVFGDRWQPLQPRQVGEVLKADHEAKREPLASLAPNPFWRPDFWELERLGFARIDRAANTVELTDAGLAAIAKYVRPAAGGAR